MANTGNQKVVRIGDETITSTDFIELTNSRVTYTKNNQSADLQVICSYSHISTAVIIAYHNIFVGNGLAVTTPTNGDGLGKFWSLTLMNNNEVSFVIERNSSPIISIALAIKVDAGAITIKQSDIPLTWNIIEV